MMSAGTCPPEYEPLRALAAHHGSSYGPKEFYWAVNDAFHTTEASLYDQIHAGMFLGAEPMWARLFEYLPDVPLDILDVGCGTGLVGEYLATLAPGKVRTLTLLDPNTAMLARVDARRSSWPFPAVTVQGDVSAVSERSFDAITISSVMHHVPELADLCARLRNLLRPGGTLLQMQDPRGEAADDLELERRQRLARARRRPGVYRRLRAHLGTIARALGRSRAPDPIEAGTNARLLKEGVIRLPLPMKVIWAVTDFHVPGQPGAMGQGLNKAQLERLLLPMRPIDYFTYDFHGMAWDQLSLEERRVEAELWAAGDPTGTLFGSAWKRAEKVAGVT